MEGFAADESRRAFDESSEISCGLFAPERDAFETLELSDGLLDAGSGPVEQLGKEGRAGFDVLSEGNCGEGALVSDGLPVGGAVISLVGESGPELPLRPEVEQDRQARPIRRLASRQVEGERMAVEIGLEVDLGREAAARSAKGLIFLPPFALAAETWARTTVLSNIWTRSREALRLARCSKNISKVPERLRRSNRRQTLFHFLNRSGRARQVMLWTEK